MKRNRTITGLLAALLLSFASCQEPIIPDTPNDPVKDGYVRVSFAAEVPDMTEVKTKVVDPDGEDISNMTLFCFDSRGLFISTVSATLTPDSGTPSLSGKFDAVIPEHTEKIHFVANQNMSLFPENNFIAKTETEVLSAMEGSSGMMIYWARFVKDANATGNVADQLKAAGTISLVRNHAKVSVSDPDGKHGVAITGFAAVNTNAFGTVAPYSDTEGWIAPSYTGGKIFVTLPHDESKLSDINDTRTIASEPYQYVFESENTSDDPVSVIIRDANAKYYRVMLMDTDGEFIPVMRNHSYIVNIAGPLSYGQDSFAEALTAPATNNVWLSISDDIKTVIGNGYQLTVEQTHVVVSDPSKTSLDLKYSLRQANGAALTGSEAPVVSWLDGNTVAQHSFTNAYSAGDGTVTINLNTFGTDDIVREGTLLVKYGTLQRKIKVTTLKVQDFEPAWVTTNVYGTGTGEKVTMMFEIPETFPAEMFPMEVFVSVNDLDVRNESGMILPVIRKDDARYGKDVYLLQGNETDVYAPTDNSEAAIGYKYVLTVNEPGTQRLYFETILSHAAAAHIDVTIEAEHFRTLTKRATFQNTSNDYILLHNLRSYVGAQPADDVIYFYLVPSKKGAVVEFPTHLATVYNTLAEAEAAGYSAGAQGWEVITDKISDTKTITRYAKYKAPGDADEFLLYSKYLDHNTDNSLTYFFNFHEINSSSYSTGGRVYGFTPNQNASLNDNYGAVFHMVTNSSQAEEVVRMASNPAGQPSVTGSGTSASAAYRSAVFELSTFHPFHFAATFNGVGNAVTGRNEETVENVTVNYGVGREAVIEFDVTSFMSSIQTVDNPLEQLSVNPFGRKFEVYIDAPMLELDEADLASNLAGKIKKDSSIPGRFIYTVDASREAERAYGAKTASVKDNSTHTYLDRVNSITVDQTGERKVIPFKTKNIVSAGDIVISSQQEEVRYYTKTFKLTNKSITGSIKYAPSGGSATNVPERSFVPMERTYDGTRIGSMTIKSDGRYELRLRAEYDFNWNTDEIMFEYTNDGVHYSVTVDSLDDLFKSPDLVLAPTAGY